MNPSTRPGVPADGLSTIPEPVRAAFRRAAEAAKEDGDLEQLLAQEPDILTAPVTVVHAAAQEYLDQLLKELQDDKTQELAAMWRWQAMNIAKTTLERFWHYYDELDYPEINAGMQAIVDVGNEEFLRYAKDRTADEVEELSVADVFDTEGK